MVKLYFMVSNNNLINTRKIARAIDSKKLAKMFNISEKKVIMFLKKNDFFGIDLEKGEKSLLVKKKKFKLKLRSSRLKSGMRQKHIDLVNIK